MRVEIQTNSSIRTPELPSPLEGEGLGVRGNPRIAASIFQRLLNQFPVGILYRFGWGSVSRSNPSPPTPLRQGERGASEFWLLRFCLLRFWPVLFALFAVFNSPLHAQSDAVKKVLPTTVKIVGSGGLRGLEAYQSGVLISSEGHVLTAWSYVLDSESTVTTNDGERFQCKLVGYDAKLEIAILKVDAEGLPHISLANTVDVSVGTQVLTFCNCYGVATGDEPVSVQRGVISAKTKLAAKRGSWQTPYTDDAYLMDAITSNPGAAGGMVCDFKGQPIGLIGKESRDARTGLWLSYAIPFSKLAESVDRILEGKNREGLSTSSRRTAEPLEPALLGFKLVPEVLNRTPPYIEVVKDKSVAWKAGLLADDLIVEINGLPTASCRDVAKRLGQVDRDSPVTITLQRGSEFLQVTMSLVGN